jgi:hypothetical protein
MMGLNETREAERFYNSGIIDSCELLNHSAVDNHR